MLNDFKTVDVHAHYVPQAMLEALACGKVSFPNVELMNDGEIYKLGFAGKSLTRPVNTKLRDLEPRQMWMSEQGVSVQINGGWLDSFGYELTTDEGLNWSKFLNEYLIEGARSAGNLVPLGSVPLQDGEKAARLLEELMIEGIRGVMIGTQPYGDNGVLDAPELDAFWATASEHSSIVFIHPMYGCGDSRLTNYDMINAVGRGVDTTIAVARLLFSGHFLKYPDMSVVIPHGGGALPWMLGRLKRNVEIHPDIYSDPEEGFRRLYFDSIVFDPDALNFLIAKAGARQVMLGSDYPFPIGDHNPKKVVDDAGLSEIDASSILGNNAAKLFQLENVKVCGC